MTMAVGVARCTSTVAAWDVAAFKLSRVRGDVVRGLERGGRGINCERKQIDSVVRSIAH